TWLMVDDAHGVGVLGAAGRGTGEHFGVEGRIPIRMGTLGKALGAEGGFIAGCGELIEYLQNRARTFVFSTAPAPATVAAARAALRIAASEPERRGRLGALAQRMRAGLRNLGLKVPDGESPIVPVILGS